MSSNDPDSRDPKPPVRALRRIAHEAHQIRQRQEARGFAVAGDVSADLEILAALVAELADTVISIQEER